MPSRLAKIGRSLPGSTIRAHMGWACSSATTTTSKSVLCRANSAGGAGTRLVVIDQEEQYLRLEGLPCDSHPPSLSLLRQFSAPVKLEMGRPTSELVHLLACDSDPFSRWDAGQLLLSCLQIAHSNRLSKWVGLEAKPRSSPSRFYKTPL